MIKIINKRNDGSIFHYAHFICDCLFPEIVNGLYKYKTVVREKSIDQTIGNFYKIYEEVMSNKNIELINSNFNNLFIKTMTYKPKEYYCNRIYFDHFRNFIFSRYNINPVIYNKKYSPIILIKRYNRINLIDDTYLKSINTNITNGKERREINEIYTLEKYLKDKYNNSFSSVFLELVSFEEQVNIFNNAKMIICAHGAGMSNMFFCKDHTKIIEITCGIKWVFFDTISKILNLNHIKCNINEINTIIQCVEENMTTELSSNHDIQ
jgi:hypothetical protein